MERLTLSNNKIHTDAGIWILKNGNPKELISDDCDEYEYFKKLAEYEDLEEQGKLLKLPCAVGDTVYRVSKHWVYIESCQITGFAECNSVKSMCYIVYIDPDEEDVIALSDFGKTVFLTKSAAEQALKEMEEKK